MSSAGLACSGGISVVHSQKSMQGSQLLEDEACSCGEGKWSPGSEGSMASRCMHIPKPSDQPYQRKQMFLRELEVLTRHRGTLTAGYNAIGRFCLPKASIGGLLPPMSTSPWKLKVNFDKCSSQARQPLCIKAWCRIVSHNTEKFDEACDSTTGGLLYHYFPQRQSPH